MKKVSMLKPLQIRSLIQKMPRPMENSEACDCDVTMLQSGGYFLLNKETFYVEDVNRYESSKDKWYELVIVSLATGQRTFLEWEIDDGLEIYLYNQNKNIRELGLTSDTLSALFNSPNLMDDHSISVNGVKMWGEEVGTATFYKSNGTEGEKYRYWDFEPEGDEALCVGIECWDGSEYEASVGTWIDPNNIEILVKGG